MCCRAHWSATAVSCNGPGVGRVGAPLESVGRVRLERLTGSEDMARAEGVWGGPRALTRTKDPTDG